MDNYEFRTILKEYKEGNPQRLGEWIRTTQKMTSFHWFYVAELLREQRFLNMPAGDFYIEGTLNFFTETLKKTKDNGKLSLDYSLSIKVLAENTEEFKEFLETYVKKAVKSNDYTLSSTLLGFTTGRADKFWESFYHFFLGKMFSEEFSDVQIKNIVKNCNTIFDLDISQHYQIMKAIEFECYPFSKVMECLLSYTNDYDKYVMPKHDLHVFGRNEENIQQVKCILTTLEKIKLEHELNNLDTKINKKIKI